MSTITQATGDALSMDQRINQLSDQAAVEAYVRVELFDEFLSLFGNRMVGTEQYDEMMQALLHGSPEMVRVWISDKCWFGSPTGLEGDKFINALFDKLTDTDEPIQDRRKEAVEWLKMTAPNTGVDRARIVHATIENWEARQ